MAAAVAALFVGRAAPAGENITLSIVPIGGTSVTGGELVTVEVFISADTHDQVIRGAQVDLPCSLLGGIGDITTGNADTDPASNVTINVAGSAGGVPFLFPGGLSVVNSNFCRAAGTFPIGGEPVILAAGQTRYLATFRYRVSPCAAGEFDIVFECDARVPIPTRCRGAPFGVSDQTRIQTIADVPVPYAISTASLSPAVGQCCRSGNCLGQANEYCCMEEMGGTHWDPDLTCDDGCPCLSTAQCSDGNACTRDDCLKGRCTNVLDTSRCDDSDNCTDDRCIMPSGACENIDRGCFYGDIGTRDCRVDEDDLDCALEGFAQSPACPSADVFPCAPDDEITFDDVLALAAAMTGRPPCPDPDICP